MITVLMATRNGEGWLERSLQSFAALIGPAQGWKLVVVNNASTDSTLDILQRFADRLPLTVLHTARPGKNAALNHGLAQVEGELVAFTDDDVIVDPHWLLHLVAAADAEPDFAVFGGAIRPVWPHAPERWITDLVPLGLTFSLTPPLERGRCTADAVWGPNMAVRRSVFRAGQRFDESIGPDGSARYAMGSETSLTRRLAARGQRCFHVPEAIVGHIIRPTQMTRDFALRRAYRFGRGKGMLAQELEPVAAVAGVPRYFLREAAEAAVRVAAARLQHDAARAFQAAWRWNYALGCIGGARQAASVTAARPVARPDLAAAPSLRAAVPA